MNHADWLERVRHQHLTVLLDLDGTLIPFADTVEDAHLDRAAANLLSALTFAGVRVVIVSGRKVEHMPPSNLWCVAEHGAWRRADGEWEGHAMASNIGTLLEQLTAIAEVPGTFIERKSLAVCVHWRRVAQLHRASVIDATERALRGWVGSNPDFELLTGVEALEVRHRSATKAHAVTWVRERIPDSHLLAIGDSETDEDMFSQLRVNEVGVAVGGRLRSSRAQASLGSPTAVRDFLWWIVEARTRKTDRPPPIATRGPLHG